MHEMRKYYPGDKTNDTTQISWSMRSLSDSIIKRNLMNVDSKEKGRDIKQTENIKQNKWRGHEDGKKWHLRVVFWFHQVYISHASSSNWAPALLLIARAINYSHLKEMPVYFSFHIPPAVFAFGRRDAGWKNITGPRRWIAPILENYKSQHYCVYPRQGIEAD